MPKVNVNAFGVVNLKFAAYALKSTSFQFAACALKSTSFQSTGDNIQWPVARFEFGPPQADYFAVHWMTSCQFINVNRYLQ